ncbi:hypothetical protein [Aquabacterium sp. J223]|uniref:hypothetical protein n=1 Tax=Aquabacterium sp. J223 TaxID=2898431 RepID=UPI0021ADEC0A|nr:hypothetical protein [Aquabacterium sp. J223]UUX95364.1 hypothetical protein LRS07_19470 [Aquabacterium sp. J223]
MKLNPLDEETVCGTRKREADIAVIAANELCPLLTSEGAPGSRRSGRRHSYASKQGK